MYHVIDKDKIWNYIKTKYIIAEEGKNYVFSRIGILWRKYKCSVKAYHYSVFDNDVDRLNHAPDIIPEKHFMDLIEYWNLDVVQVCLLCSVFLGEYVPSLVYVYTIMYVLSFHLFVLCSN
ncbi:hypothetical protein LIER_43885 [Lithospermum erythrorhizon]|uniref:Uncharacterized protein n=1 Tax=Lithospermum erythrorhizon TaxID=34254 RepID=A0AAV3R5L4_LITER